ncbi:uncharacterized protein [Aegilops tauschii subsp. strangulata]|uniref:uncharacterized protein n=1 Tax=Aegilops tauschii subsp. strangulata TaxID=200361 RepID=UPI003CC8B2B8
MSSNASTYSNPFPVDPAEIRDINVHARVPVVLDASNSTYFTWKTYFTLLFRENNLVDHVDRTVDSRAMVDDAEWTAIDATIIRWFFTTISKDLVHTVVSAGDDARALWVKLNGLFTDNKLQHRVFLQQEFFDCHQDEQSIDDYCRRLKTLADELRDIGAKVDDDLLLRTLTAGLNEDFGNAASNLTFMPEPSFPKFVAYLRLEERRMKGVKKRVQHHAFAAGTSRGAPPPTAPPAPRQQPPPPAPPGPCPSTGPPAYGAATAPAYSAAPAPAYGEFYPPQVPLPWDPALLTALHSTPSPISYGGSGDWMPVHGWYFTDVTARTSFTRCIPPAPPPPVVPPPSPLVSIFGPPASVTPTPPLCVRFFRVFLSHLLHSDVWTSLVASNTGYLYYLVILDGFTHYVWTFPLRRKSDALATLTAFYSYVTTQFGRPILALQTDNGKEFDNVAVRNLLASHGTIFRLTCPYTSQQNGRAEHVIRTLNDCVRTLLFHSYVPPRFWPDVLASASLLINIRPCHSHWSYTPHQLLFGVVPSYDGLRIFGCLCYPSTASTAPHKLAPRSLPCIFLGYPPNTKGYRCYDPVSHRVFTLRHVYFDELVFPFQQVPSPSASPAARFAPASSSGEPTNRALGSALPALPAPAAPIAATPTAAPSATPTMAPSAGPVAAASSTAPVAVAPSAAPPWLPRRPRRGSLGGPRRCPRRGPLGRPRRRGCTPHRCGHLGSDWDTSS